MTPKKKSGDNWEVQVVAYNGLQLSPSAAPEGTLTRVDIDKLLDTLALFADKAGQRLNGIDVCPSEMTIEGHVSLDVGGALVFGVSAGISVSMTWRFEEEWTSTRPGKRPLEPEPPKP